MLDILQHVVAAQPDMAIVAMGDDDDLSIVARRTRADVVVLGGQASRSDRDVASLLLRRPQLRVLTIAADGKSGCVYELQPRRMRLRRISARTLITAMRGRALPSTAGKKEWRSIEGLHRYGADRRDIRREPDKERA